MIDLRSDTVTKPTEAMRKVMAEAEVGDDVFGEDPTINRLETLAAEILGTESAIFATSGTQTNLLALLSHCERGDEYIVGQGAHTYLYEGGGAAVLGSIQPQPLDLENDGTIDLKKAESLIKPNDYHFAKTKLFCLENTQSGQTLPLEYFKEAARFVERHGLGFHLDGARIFNAAIKLNASVDEIVKDFDTISVCLSKGLGAPVGSVLCGKKDNIAKARRWRKVLGGGMRQAGIIAAAGIYALENNVSRLEEDHNNARLLAEGLNEISELSVDYSPSQTNMVFLTMNSDTCLRLSEFLKNHGIIIANRSPVRLVTHLDINEEDIKKTISCFKAFFAS